MCRGDNFLFLRLQKTDAPVAAYTQMYCPSCKTLQEKKSVTEEESRNSSNSLKKFLQLITIASIITDHSQFSCEIAEKTQIA